MQEYQYKVFNDKGQIHFGRLEATGLSGARQKLLDQDLVIIDIKPLTSGLSQPSFRNKISMEQELFFYIQFASLLASDVPIVRALEIISPQIRHTGLRHALEECQKDIHKGSSFSEALQKHDSYFSNLMIGMVQAGEESGKLDIIFKQLARYAEERSRFRSDLFNAVSYPALLFLTAIVVTSVVIIFVFPLFLEIFEANNVPLPLPTQIFASLGVFLRKYGLILFGGLVLVGAGLFRYHQTPEGRAAIDRSIQKIPWIGSIVKQFHLQQLFFNMALLLKNGIPLLTCMELLVKTLSNITMTQLLADIWVTLRQGGAMSDAIKKHEDLPVLVHQMTVVGEQTGNLAVVLDEMAGYYSTTTNRRMRRLTFILEPLLLFMMGILVTLLLASLLLPMFQMVRTLR